MKDARKRAVNLLLENSAGLVLRLPGMDDYRFPDFLSKTKLSTESSALFIDREKS